MNHEQVLSQASAAELAQVGIQLPLGGRPIFKNEMGRKLATARDEALIGNPSVGIPDYLSLYIDPQSVKALFTPMRAEETFGAFQYGDWATKIYQFRFEEVTGNVAAYGDFNKSGTTGANYNWLTRNSYEFETFIQFGDRDVDEYARANIDRVGDLKYAGVLTLDKTRNATYYFGVDGLLNYGLFNDPNLNPTIQPNTKASGGTSWDNATNIEIYNDFIKLVAEIQENSGGILEYEDAFTVTLSPSRMVRLLATDAYIGSKSALDLIKESFPKLKFVQAVEMKTTAGEQITFIADSLNGQPVCAAGFTQKFRAHRLVPETTSYHQKMSAGSWGLIVKQPVGIASMLGI